MIDAVPDGKVVMWQNQRGRDTRRLIARADFSYVVVLSERPSHFVLVTAYPVEREHRREKLRREYEAAQRG